MSNDTYQVIIGNGGCRMKTRTLKIESAGDYWRGRVTPKIRLAGQWLDRAGFKPGSRVEIELIQPGKIVLKSLPQHDNSSLQPHSATKMNLEDLL